MKAYYYDGLPGDQRLAHEPSPPAPVTPQVLKALGVEYSFHPTVDTVETFAKERGYVNRDEITISTTTLSDYENRVKQFFDEHLHEDEEIRYLLDGSGYFDVRADVPSLNDKPSDEKKADDAQEREKWIRIWLEKGDLIVLPSGIYHRFTTDSKNYTKAMRLFREEPKWTPLSRSDPATDNNPYRLEYVRTQTESNK